MLPIALLAAAALACASGPRIEVGTGEAREFSTEDRFAPAHIGVLEIENPVLESAELWSVQRALERAIGWRGLRTSVPEDADWLVSCAFRKRLIWPDDPNGEGRIEPWSPMGHTPVVGTRRGGDRRTAVDPTLPPPPPEPWIETYVELKLRSRRTGTVAWSAKRRWARNRSELPEEELRETLDLLLARLRLQGRAEGGPRAD